MCRTGSTWSTSCLHVHLLASALALTGKPATGGLLDYDAVAEGLQDGRIGGLGLDVQWSEPWNPADPMTSHAR